jgi:chromosome segregation ATPase
MGAEASASASEASEALTKRAARNATRHLESNSQLVAALQRASQTANASTTAAQAEASKLQAALDATKKLRGAGGQQHLKTLEATVSAQQQELDKARAEEKKANKLRGEVQRKLNPAYAVADALNPAPNNGKRPREAEMPSVDAMIDRSGSPTPLTRPRARTPGLWQSGRRPSSRWRRTSRATRPSPRRRTRT